MPSTLLKNARAKYHTGEEKANTFRTLFVIAVKSAARFSTQPACGNIFFQQRARSIFGITESLLKDVQDIDTYIQPDKVG
jgi:hypothetical protein